ncbi:MAG: sigma-70 family RNA polymerase sigma factor [Lachnospiraceae bacterium]|jgi:RNA polymerase sigma factor (sigma-70 family)|nr:sigma-70 family RNA polymerase sigma factor [Lachnospiraceae bacterium]MCX4317944.1 sigma-70 family RNA polymerase sigma factor [Lachnospiraceae bacterium]
MNQREEELIRLLCTREEKGLSLLQQEYGGLLHYVVWGILQVPQDVEECMNDIYLRIWEKADRYQTEKGTLRVWLTAVAKHAALDYAKSRNRRLEIPFSELEEMFGSSLPESSPEEIVLQKERMADWKDCIASLKPGERNLFYRRYYYLQSERQIGAELGMTKRAVEGKLYRIRKKLQKKIGQRNGGRL